MDAIKRILKNKRILNIRFNSTNINSETVTKVGEEKGYISSLDYEDLFSASSLSCMSQRLSHNFSQRVAYRFKYDKDQLISEAAVLMLFCSVNKIPSILFTVRTKTLSSHPGEISFPGGKRDPNDESLVATCLRETYEEIGINKELIHILGQYSPVPNRKGNLKVYPYVGVILKEIETENITDSEDKIQLKLNPDEVHTYFTIPVNLLLKKESIESWDAFRGTPVKIPKFHTPSHIEGYIWGLTSFVLHSVLGVCFKERYQK